MLKREDPDEIGKVGQCAPSIVEEGVWLAITADHTVHVL